MLNLVICLLYTRRPLPKSKIREAVPQYGEAATDEAFDRMFERDKDELRALGIPLVTEQIDSFFEDEEGYRIDDREYALPELSLEADELAILGLAARTWAQASLAGPAAQALRKLAAAGVERDDASIIGLEPRVRTAEPAFARAKDAVLQRRPVRFAYRTGRTGEVATRHVQPWAIAAWHGRWYLTGWDLDRQAPRVFRLGRVEGAIAWAGRPGSYDVPDDHDAVAVISAQSADAAPTTGVVRVRTGSGHALRRRAASVQTGADGWDELVLSVGDVARLADELAGHGASVVAVSPPELRAAVVERLQGALAAAAGGGAGQEDA
nr:WYL domain-containing protein [Arsenicicoccus dermatophilus]